MKRILFFAILTVIITISPAAAGMLKCADIKDDAKRLECYDAVAAKEKAKRKEGCQIHLKSMKTSGNKQMKMLTVIGEIQNVSDSTLKTVRVLINVYDKADSLIATQTGSIGFNELEPNGTSPFKVTFILGESDEPANVTAAFMEWTTKLKTCSDIVETAN